MLLTQGRTQISQTLFEGVAAPYADSLEDQCGRTKTGKGGLKHVKPRKSSQQEPLGGYPVSQCEADQNDQSGKGEYGTIKIHICFLSSDTVRRWFSEYSGYSPTG